MTDSPAPIATYTERLPQVRRDLVLFPDRIEIRASWLLGKTHRMTVRIANLTGKVTEARVRNRWAKQAVVIGSLSVATAAVLSRPGHEPWGHPVSIAAWVVAAFCAVVLAITARKVRFVRLMRADGKPGLDLAQTGPDATRLEEFLEAIRRQIRKV